jgi:hypothetical protein
MSGGLRKRVPQSKIRGRIVGDCSADPSGEDGVLGARRVNKGYGLK